MTERHDTVVSFRDEVLRSSRSVLDELVREGARRILQEALKLEVGEFIGRHHQARDEQGRRQVVRNGYLPGREVVSGVGPLEVRQPRVRGDGIRGSGLRARSCRPFSGAFRVWIT